MKEDYLLNHYSLKVTYRIGLQGRVLALHIETFWLQYPALSGVPGHSQEWPLNNSEGFLPLCVPVCTHVYIHIHACPHVSIHTCACLYVCAFVCTHVVYVFVFPFCGHIYAPAPKLQEITWLSWRLLERNIFSVIPQEINDFTLHVLQLAGSNFTNVRVMLANALFWCLEF